MTISDALGDAVSDTIPSVPEDGQAWMDLV